MSPVRMRMRLLARGRSVVGMVEKEWGRLPACRGMASLTSRAGWKPAPSGTLPAHHHVGFDDFAGVVEVGAGFVHVEADRMDLVAGGAGQAVASHGAGIDLGIGQP